MSIVVSFMFSSVSVSKMEGEFNSCLICASQCQSHNLTNNLNGKVKRERNDVEIITADQLDEHPNSSTDAEEEHLTPYFVLRNILKVPTETLEQFNYGKYNSQDPLSQGNGVDQVPLCPPCAELARQFHETFEQVSRLQMILSGIQAEFMDKIQQNKDDQCQGTSSIWNQIRRQIVLESFGDDPPAQPEGTDDLEEKWHFGETMMEAEGSDEPDDDEANFGVATFPLCSYSSSALRFDPASHLQMNESLSLGSLVPLAPKKRKASRAGVNPVMRSGKKYWLQCPNCPYRTVKSGPKWMDTHLLLHEEGSQAIQCEDCGCYVAPEKLASHRALRHPLPRTIRKKMKKTAQPQPAPELQCTFCPHKTTNLPTYNRHQEVHQLWSQATVCSGCGIFFPPTSFGYHQNSCASVIRKSLGRDELLVGSEGKMRNINSSNPGFISFNRELNKRKVYQCRQCPYETLRLARIKIHAELHEEGSQAVACEECGWLLPPDQLDIHRDVNHSTEELPSEVPACVDLEEGPSHPISKKIPLLFSCDQCPYESNAKLSYEKHMTLHSEDSNAIPCPDCHVFYRSSFNMTHHLQCGKLKTLRRALAAKARAGKNNRGKVEDNPSQPPNAV